ncbi:GNAT family N-acetyltransferase [Microbispora sp. H10949]|uniref:GNAT family N-acetyltransferase n=1 Tax=Microbispora sp. H10949 TaxID=2729111 RepID=UPI0015FEF605|nr:GNAT family N-acetyltransferase [Microbispora sp. H10949]
MKIETVNGLTIGLVDVGEAENGDWERHQGELDLVRVVDPPPESWPRLRAAGFAVHPSWITWMAPVAASEEEFLSRLSVQERRNVRLGLRYAAGRDVRMDVADPVDDLVFDDFLKLYEPHIGGMRHGVPYASMEREEILGMREDYFAVQAFEDDTLVGCCMCRKRADASTVVIRFVTTTQDSRQHRIVRAMYMRVFAKARELGYRSVSLGTDPALYGHIAKPGLFRFKSRLGFTPIPARLFGTMDDPDEATRVLRLDTLTEPSLLISYAIADDAGAGEITFDTPLRLDVLTGEDTTDPEQDLGPYRAPFLTGVGLVRIG